MIRSLIARAGIAASLCLVACGGSSGSPTGSPSTQAGGGGSTGTGGSTGSSGSTSSGGSTSAGGSTSVGGGTSTGGSAGVATAYPAGPYGKNVGETFPNIAWTGYADWTGDAIATSKTFGPVTMNDARLSGKKYLLLNIAEFYCPGCTKSATLLGMNGKPVLDGGGAIIEVLASKGFLSGSAPAKADLDAWVTKYKLVETVVMDPAGSGTPTLDAYGPRDTAYVIDLSTMKVVKNITGSFTGTTPGSIEQGLAEMKTLLGI